VPKPPLTHYRIDDKTFELLYPKAVIQERVTELAAILNQRFESKNEGRGPILMPVLTGALMFFGELVPLLHFGYEIAPIKISSYGSGMISGGLPAIPESHIPVGGRDIIILEDIVDSGNTAIALHAKLREQNCASVYFASLLFKPHAFKGTIRPDWAGFEIGDAFVIGFGLDYAERGRHLRGIYQLVAQPA
jgi:hypoxanthine phosphoribosyltransferase